MAVDPTYPLLPFFSLLSASVLLFLLVTNVIRHSWNLGVTFLAFWLFWENLFVAVGAIIWSDNEDIKLYVYCDIVSHVNEFTYILKPACTLILTRRLYKIASLRRVIPESRRARLVDAIIEWFLGLGLPMLVMGVFYYIVQGVRFVVDEGSGCNNAENTTGVDIFLMDTPGLVLPLISLFFYCPKIVYVFYRHSRDTNEFLQTNGSVSRAGYSRILILGCLDILLTLPFGIMQLVTAIKYGSPLPWYYGWDITHSNWAPVSFSWSDFEQGGTWDFIALYIGRCSSIILALAIFALFGFTSEARATYSRGMHAILKLFGRTSAVRKRDDMGELHFGIQSLVASGQTRTQQSALDHSPQSQRPGEDAEQGLQSSVISDSHESKAVGSADQHESPNIGTVPILQAEDRKICGNGDRSNIEGGEIHVGCASDEKTDIDVHGLHFEDLHEDSCVMHPVCARSSVEGAETAYISPLAQKQSPPRAFGHVNGSAG